jgi:hypothetical protein
MPADSTLLLQGIYKVHRKVPGLLLLWLSVKEYGLLHQSATWHRAVNMYCFYKGAFSTLYFILSAMDGKIEQYVWIKFSMKPNKSTAKILEMLHEAFVEHSLSWTAVFEWHSRFTACWVSVGDDEHSGLPSTSKTTENVEKIWELIHEDRCRTIHELADTVGISYGVCQEILTDNLNMRSTARKFVPQLLMNDQKQRHVNVSWATRDG